MNAKPVTDLTPDDLARHPVWEYDLDRERTGRDETWVTPITTLPVATLSNRIAGVALRLRVQEAVGLLGNIDLANPRASREFATLSVWRGGSWFHLARYFDPDRGQRGPERLAAFLGLAVSQVFPIGYNLTQFALGQAEVLRGSIDAEPTTKLTRSERMALILGS